MPAAPMRDIDLTHPLMEPAPASPMSAAWPTSSISHYIRRTRLEWKSVSSRCLAQSAGFRRSVPSALTTYVGESWFFLT